MITTTLNAIYAHRPCGINSRGESGFSKLLKYLGKTEADDEPLPLTVVMDSNGFWDALWCVRAVDSPEHKHSAWLALSFAEDARHLMHDERSVAELDVTRRYLAGEAPIDELIAARIAADAAYAADAAAAYAAYAADAAYASAAYADAAYAAAAYSYAAADDAASAAYAAAAAYADAAYAADAVREKQKARLRRFFETGEITP